MRKKRLRTRIVVGMLVTFAPLSGAAAQAIPQSPLAGPYTLSVESSLEKRAESATGSIERQSTKLMRSGCQSAQSQLNAIQSANSQTTGSRQRAIRLRPVIEALQINVGRMNDRFVANGNLTYACYSVR